VLSPEAWRHVADHATGTDVISLTQQALRDGKPRKHPAIQPIHDGYIRLEALSPSVIIPKLAEPCMQLTAAHVPLLKRYIPQAVFSKLVAQHNRHLGEMRPV
jgi:hypothetical protein